MNLSLLIKNDQLASRKIRDNLKTSLLTTVLGDLQKIAKEANQEIHEVTDDKVFPILKKFLKGITETLELVPDSVVAKSEKEIIEAYFPKQLTIEELTSNIIDIIATIDQPSIKSLGIIVKELKTKFDGQFDGKQATDIIRQQF